MYAIIETGGKQYRVAPEDVIDIEKIEANEDGAVTFDKVLAIRDADGMTVGTPAVEGAVVTASLVEQFRDRKITVMKFKKRKGYRRKQGHRQSLSRVRINDIVRGE